MRNRERRGRTDRDLSHTLLTHSLLRVRVLFRGERSLMFSAERRQSHRIAEFSAVMVPDRDRVALPEEGKYRH
jgi:hypothetical protein